jgi:hypothetical protein
MIETRPITGNDNDAREYCARVYRDAAKRHRGTRTAEMLEKRIEATDSTETRGMTNDDRKRRLALLKVGK